MNPSALSRISSRICRAVVRPRKLLNLRSMANAGMSERVTQTNDLPKKGMSTMNRDETRK